MSTARVNQWWVSGFTADTPVLMADGKKKPISKIKEGEYVASFDPETRKVEPGLVTKTWSEVMSDILEINIEDNTMTVASEQRFFTPTGEFKSAADAVAILAEDGTTKKFTAKKIPGKAKLYDITVDDKHAFFANGLMVHNKGKSRPAPPPPPDPVVTAGKIGQPLTVTVNGNTITVPSSPESSAQVSVSYRGAVSTGYAGSPGVAPLWPVLSLPRNPRVPAAVPPRNSMNDAIAIRNYVCNEMTGYTGAVVGQRRSDWISNLNQMSRIVNDARRSSRGVWDRPGRNPVDYARWCGTSTDITTAYDDALDDISQLTKYVQKNKNFTSKDSAFIAGKCAEIESNFNKITGRLTAIVVNPPAPPLPLPNAEYINGKVYYGEPRYPYFVQSGNVYTYSPPNAIPSGNYVKTYDADRGLYYFAAVTA